MNNQISVTLFCKEKKQIELLPSIKYIFNEYGFFDKYNKINELLKNRCENQYKYLNDNFIYDLKVCLQKNFKITREYNATGRSWPIYRYGFIDFKKSLFSYHVFGNKIARMDEFPSRFGYKVGNSKIKRKIIPLTEYKNRIPHSVIQEIENFENQDIIKNSKIMDDFEFNYYIADTIDGIDPILFLNIGDIEG